MKKFENSVVFVIGGCSGVGMASALLMAQQGAKIVIADLHEESCRDALNAFRSVGGEGAFIRCDVTKIEEVKNAISETINRFGRLDIAFNNAGIDTEEPQFPVYDDEIEAVNIYKNRNGIQYTRYGFAERIKQKSAAIINMAIILGHYSVD
jgi:NAD(P)-dependent dehydrogenase (short-subunit alcohol dehydrogenase family)